MGDGPERGLILVGIDVICEYLTEINATSPTGIREVKQFGRADIAALVWDAVKDKGLLTIIKTHVQGRQRCGRS